MKKGLKNVETEFLLQGGQINLIHNDLEAFKCEYNKKEKTFKTPKLKKTDHRYRRIHSMVLGMGATMIPLT